MLNVGVLTGIVLLIYSGVIMHQSLTLAYFTPMGPGPGFLPTWLSGILLVVSVLFIWESIKGGTISVRELFPRGTMLLDIVLMFVGLGFTGFFLEKLGFITCGTVLLVLMTIRHYKWYYVLPIAIGVSFLIFTIFETFLGVPMPVNDFGW